MRRFLLIIATLCLMVSYTNCAKTSSSSGGGGGVQNLSVAGCSSLKLPSSQTGTNVVPVCVGGAGGTVNQPMVTVTICTPGTTNCQTIPNVLLDTGSFGLRLFGSLLSIPLTQSTDKAGLPLAECVNYAGGTSQWGWVATADIQMGGEWARAVPMQVIDSGYGTRPSNCSDAVASPEAALFNGILGVGLLQQDCGSACVNTGASTYYACSGGKTCANSTGVALASQVTNPVSLLPIDNNGVILQLPNVSDSGAVEVLGNMLLGIGTEPAAGTTGMVNNSVLPAHVYQADQYANFTTFFNGRQMSGSFIDSGSNGLYFNTVGDSQLPSCKDNEFFCPTSQVTKLAYMEGSGSTTKVGVNFNIANTDSLSGSNWVFNNLGAAGGDFDWGLPFFLGRSVLVCIEGKTSWQGTGPYWAW